jgi:hypothetical protein
MRTVVEWQRVMEWNVYSSVLSESFFGVVRMELRWNACEQSHFLWWLRWENDSAEQMGLVVAWYLWSMEHSFNSGLVRAVVGSVGNWQAGLGHHCLAMFPRVFLPIGCRVQQVAYLLMGSLSAGGKTGDRLTHVRRSTMTIFQVDFHWTVAFLNTEQFNKFSNAYIITCDCLAATNEIALLRH